MLTTLAISNYRSLVNLVIPLKQLNVITGVNGSGKSNVYRALRLLAETAQGGVIQALAYEGGLQSTFWAGPEEISARMRRGEVPIQSTNRKEPLRLKLGFSNDELGYSIALGLPIIGSTAFSFDPEIKHECIWAESFYRPARALVERQNAVIKTRDGRSWKVISQRLNFYDSMFDQSTDPNSTPDIFYMRETIRSWRFYDHFRTDKDAPARQAQLGTRTTVLNHDGHDLAAALQTIHEIGNIQALNETIDDAFPGARLKIACHLDGRFSIEFYQYGLLRPLSSSELSDGTLRYILWVAALLTPRPPLLMVLNEPETSLHPDLLPALARLIINASKYSQIIVVSHASRLIHALKEYPESNALELEKKFGQTELLGQDLLNTPTWHWPD